MYWDNDIKVSQWQVRYKRFISWRLRTHNLIHNSKYFTLAQCHKNNACRFFVYVKMWFCLCNKLNITSAYQCLGCTHSHDSQTHVCKPVWPQCWRVHSFQCFQGRLQMPLYVLCVSNIGLSTKTQTFKQYYKSYNINHVHIFACGCTNTILSSIRSAHHQRSDETWVQTFSIEKFLCGL